MIEPQTDRAWRLALASVHPDGLTPDVEAFIRLQEARAKWQKAQPRLCRQCGVKPIPTVTPQAGRSRRLYCDKYCANLALAQAQRKPRRLR